MAKDNKKGSVREAIKEAGNKITAKELGAIQEKFGSKAVEKAKEYAKNTPDVRLNSQARAFVPAAPVPPPATKANIKDFIERKEFGNTIGSKELQKIENKFGEQGVLATNKVIKGDGNIKFNPNAKDYYKTILAGEVAPLATDTTTANTVIPEAGTPGTQTLPGEITVPFANLEMAKTGANISGGINLQKIVNAGYKEIAKIERGAQMMGNITSMFNF
jgi:hypothetical protein